MAFATIGTAGIQAQSIDLSTKVTGTLPVPNGGLGIASGTTGQFLKFTGTETLASAAVQEGLAAASQWRLTTTFSNSALPITKSIEALLSFANSLASSISSCDGSIPMT